jgi:hypothetical protein
MNELEVSDRVEVRFDRDELFNRVIHESRVPSDGETFVIGDYAISANPKSDFSCLVAGKIVDVADVRHLYVLDAVIGRWRAAELPSEIVSFVQKYKPVRTMIERLSMWELLEQAILLESRNEALPVRVTWFKPSKKRAAKDLRVREFQRLFDAGRVHFVSNPYIEPAIDQLCSYVGGRSNRGRKDELADVFGYFAQLMNGQL